MEQYSMKPGVDKKILVEKYGFKYIFCVEVYIRDGGEYGSSFVKNDGTVFSLRREYIEDLIQDGIVEVTI